MRSEMTQTTSNARDRRRRCTLAALAGLVLASAAPGLGQVRVQDVARLQGQRTNPLMGYGLVVGLEGTGDGGKNVVTMRALMQMHQRFAQPVVAPEELKNNKSVALVAVTAEVPEFGAREGQTLDVRIAALGEARSLKGGTLLVTPLQYALFDEQDPMTQGILALAGGRISLVSEAEPSRGIISQGATLEEDFIYSFIEDDRITLVLDDAHAGWPWAQMIARAINHEHSGALPLRTGPGGEAADAGGADVAIAADPRNVIVVIPGYERSNPAAFISRVLQTPLFMLPQQQARVTINRATKTVSFTGSVRVSPTTLAVPGLGNVTIGRSESAGRNGAAGAEAPARPAPAGTAAPAASSTARPASAAVEFSEFLAALSGVKASPDQIIAAIENLQRSGSLHAQVQYE